MTDTKVYKCYRQCRRGQANTQDKPRPGTTVTTVTEENLEKKHPIIGELFTTRPCRRVLPSPKSITKRSQRDYVKVSGEIGPLVE